MSLVSTRGIIPSLALKVINQAAVLSTGFHFSEFYFNINSKFNVCVDMESTCLVYGTSGLSCYVAFNILLLCSLGQQVLTPNII
jgi:hypothetical protein